MPAIAAAHNIPYVATACPSYPFDMMEKVKKAAAVNGPAYVHVLSVCPTGWRCQPDVAVSIGRAAVETAVFPLYEVENGQYRLNVNPTKIRPIQEYFKMQGRFGHLSEATVQQIQERVLREYGDIKKKAGIE